jgi:rod shape-determining protein MreB
MFFNFSQDVAIDLGTANTLVYIRGEGIVLNEPSIVVVDSDTNEVREIGYEALQMHERTHQDIETIWPLRDGVIADFKVAEEMIQGLLRKVKTNWLTSIRSMVVCVPSGITEVEKRAVRDSAEHAGARKVNLVSEPMAAAIGIGLDIQEAVGNMVVDVGGSELDKAIVQYFKRNHNLLIGSRTAERIKCEVGSAIELDTEMELSVKGRDLVSGIPKVRTISSVNVREALHDNLEQISAAVLRTLERTPPELGADVLERGIMMTGGGALLQGIDQMLRDRVELPVYVAEDPLKAVVRGTGEVLENLEDYERVLT